MLKSAGSQNSDRHLRGIALFALIPLTLMIISTFNNNWERWGSAHRLWLDAANKSPLKQRPRINLAYQYQLEGDYPNALREYSNAQLLYPETPAMGLTNRMFVAQNVGQIYIQLGDYAQAADILTDAWNRQPGHPGVAVNLSKVIFETGAFKPNQAQLALSILDYAASLRHATNWKGTFGYFTGSAMAKVYMNRAVILYFLGRCEDAAKNVQMAQEDDPIDFSEVKLRNCNPGLNFSY